MKVKHREAADRVQQAEFELSQLHVIGKLALCMLAWFVIRCRERTARFHFFLLFICFFYASLRGELCELSWYDELLLVWPLSELD